MPARIERFCKTTRWVHGCFALLFLLLAGTGGALVLGETLGLSLPARGSLGRLHRGAGVALFTAPALVWLSGHTAATARDLARAFRWSREDLRWLALQPKAALGRAELPPAGKLNAGQKANALLTLALAGGLGATGAWLWWRPGALVPWLLHLALFAAWLPAFLGHAYLALVHPATRPALRAMWGDGSVRLDWARHHHPRWVDSALRGGEGRARRAATPSRSPVPAPATSRADGRS